MADSTSSSKGTMLIQGVLAILGLVGLYYLYKYLFSSDVASAMLLSGKQNATTLVSSGATALTISKNQLPALYTGGEFAVSTWIQIQKLEGSNKSILRIAGSDDYDSLRIYLSGAAAQLMVRFTTGTENQLSTDDGMLKSKTSIDYIQSSQSNSRGLQSRTVQPQQLFTTTAGSSTNTGPNSCDVIQIDMQRWIHIVVSVNGMSSDVYMDGKLVRSCILPNYIKFGDNPTVYLLDDGKKKSEGGFGGYISTTQMFGGALSPDIVYQMYMAGPEPITNFWQYITAFMSPTAAY
jgi:hypothetical protein